MKSKIREILGGGQRRVGLGFRTIKTAFAVVACLVIYDILFAVFKESLFRTGYAMPFYACTAAIICMQDTVHNTLRQGISRLIGTFFGGILGILVLFFINRVNQPLYIIIIGICMVLCISACNLVGQQAACAICCVVFLALMVHSGDENSRYFYAFYRIIETTAGILIAALINRFFNKPRWMDKIELKIKDKLFNKAANKKTAKAAE